MTAITRRQALISAGCAAAAAPFAGAAAAAPPASRDGILGDEVRLTGDGLSLSPQEFAGLLGELTATAGVEADYYSIGGAVAAMEKVFAGELGKERAVFFPTGTLANHVAIRLLAGGDARVLVQERSHVYNDSGDCVQQLSHLDLVPLGEGRASFSPDDVKRELARAEGGRVRTGVGVISIESPVRRKLGEVVDFAEMQEIASLARGRGIRLHLDGARMFLAAPYTGVSVREYASLFDTVYVSLWKYFNAPFGAVLAGPAALLDDAFHTRRMFGGGLPYAWPAALVAGHFLPGFADRFAAAAARSERLLALLAEHGRLRIGRIPNGTNYARLEWDGEPSPEELGRRLAARGVRIGPPSQFFRGIVLCTNETLNRRQPEAVAELFREALAGP